MKYTISEEVLNRTLGLLVTLPYNQSAETIAAIQQDVVPVEEQQDSETTAQPEA